MLLKIDNPLAACDLKTHQGKGTFAGYAATFNGVDAYGDTILAGAFAETIKERSQPPHMLLNHAGRELAIGLWKSLAEDDHGLKVQGELTPGNSRSDDVRASMKHGTIRGLSIGFRIPIGGAEENDKGGRIISKIDLVEVSVVTMPADKGAQIDISTVKAEIETITSLKDAEAFLRESGMWSRSMACAFVSQLKTLIQSDSEEDAEQIRALRGLGNSLDRYSLQNLLNR